MKFDLRTIGTLHTGTVTNVKEACAWLSYTYLFVRMLKNPLAYGVPWEEIASDPRLEGHRKTLITTAARQLEKNVPLLTKLSSAFCTEDQDRGSGMRSSCFALAWDVHGKICLPA